MNSASSEVSAPMVDLEDRPSAGTACASCKDQKHFCQAIVFSANDRPLCGPCSRGEDCRAIMARKTPFPGQLDDPFNIPLPPPAVRHVEIPTQAQKPVPEPTPAAQDVLAVNVRLFEPKPIPPSNKKLDWKPVIEWLRDQMRIGDTAIIPVPYGWVPIIASHNFRNAISKVPELLLKRFQLSAIPDLREVRVTRVEDTISEEERKRLTSREHLIGR